MRRVRRESTGSVSGGGVWCLAVALTEAGAKGTEVAALFELSPVYVARSGELSGQNGRAERTMPGIVQLSILWMPLCVRRVVASSRPDPPSSSLNASARFAELVALRRKITMGSESGLVRARNTTPRGPKLPFTALLLLVPPAGPTRGCKRRLTAHPKIRAALGSRSLNRFLEATRLEPTANR